MSAWAKRKAAVKAEAEAQEKARQEAVIAEQHADLEEKTEEEVLADLDLPIPEDMQPGDDFSAFMKIAVSASLRNRALRTLWRSNPVLANVDMLVDYGEDFTGKSDPVGLIKTIYRVGKGMVPDEDEEETVGDTTINTTEDNAVPDVLAESSKESEVEVETVEVKSASMELEKEAPVPLVPRRRMRFDFGEGTLPGTLETDLHFRNGNDMN